MNAFCCLERYRQSSLFPGLIATHGKWGDHVSDSTLYHRQKYLINLVVKKIKQSSQKTEEEEEKEKEAEEEEGEREKERKKNRSGSTRQPFQEKTTSTAGTITAMPKRVNTDRRARH